MKPMLQPDLRATDHKKFAIQRCEEPWATRILVCSVIGIASLVLGLWIGILNLVGLITQQWIARTGACLLLVSFVCLIAIGHLLDKTDEDVRALREDFCDEGRQI
jgi:hypothetical protein